jgi:hypothetical protein
VSAESLTPLADRLGKLRADVEAAERRRSEAKDRRRHEFGKLPAEATADLVAFRDDIALKRPSATPPDEREDRLRELTENLITFMQAHGLVFQAVGRGGSVAITDPSVSEDVQIADADVVAARQAAKDFENENAEAIEAERKAAQAAEVRAAIEDGDRDKIKEALAV